MTLETIIDEILEHDKQHPDHGIGCACMDKHTTSIRRLLYEKDITYEKNPKTYSNFRHILYLLTR